jgi:hypothetical protein
VCEKIGADWSESTRWLDRIGPYAYLARSGIAGGNLGVT